LLIGNISLLRRKKNLHIDIPFSLLFLEQVVNVKNGQGRESGLRKLANAPQ
jgi:hypothetical protein